MTIAVMAAGCRVDCRLRQLTGLIASESATTIGGDERNE